MHQILQREVVLERYPLMVRNFLMTEAYILGGGIRPQVVHGLTLEDFSNREVGVWHHPMGMVPEPS